MPLIWSITAFVPSFPPISLLMYTPYRDLSLLYIHSIIYFWSNPCPGLRPQPGGWEPEARGTRAANESVSKVNRHALSLTQPADHIFRAHFRGRRPPLAEAPPPHAYAAVPGGLRPGRFDELLNIAPGPKANSHSRMIFTYCIFQSKNTGFSLSK